MHRTKNPLNSISRTQIYPGTNTTNQRLFWKITLESDTLCVIVSYQCSSGAWEAMNPLAGFK